MLRATVAGAAFTGPLHSGPLPVLAVPNRERLGGGAGYALDSFCGMQARTAVAPARPSRQRHLLLLLRSLQRAARPLLRHVNGSRHPR